MWLLHLFSPAADRDGLIGDLAEEYRRHWLPGGRRIARRRYWAQVLRSLTPGLDRPRRALPARDTGDGRMSNWLQDVRYGARSLAQAPTFTLLTILTLTLAIGVNSAIFSMVSVIFFSDLPFQDTDNTVFLRMANPERGIKRMSLSQPDFVDLREEMRTLTQIAGASQRPAVLSGTDEPLRVLLGTATANLFRVWGTPPLLGRDLSEGEDAPGADRVLILSHGLWERRFGSDPTVVGRELKVDGYPTTVVGVAAKEIEFGDNSLIDAWVPMILEPGAHSRDQRDIFAMGRLAPDASVESAAAEAAAIGRRLAALHPVTNRGWEPFVESFDDGLADQGFWTVLLLLGITVGLVMLIACSNVATMTLARATGREQELAMRAALGAGRVRIVRQLLTESALVALVSGTLGLVVAKAALNGLTWMAGESSGISTFFAMLKIDRPVLLFTLGVSVAAPLLFGLVPALRSSRCDLAATLKAGARSSGDAATQLGRRILVGVQVALAVMLMVVAALTIRAMLDVRSLDLGYAPESILTLRVDLPEAVYPADERVQVFRQQLAEGVEALPGVVRAAWVSHRPLADLLGPSSFEIEAAEQRPDEQTPWAFAMSVDPAYFDMLHLRPLDGRLLGLGDRIDTAAVALVNAEAAERFWPDGALGQRIRLGGGRWQEVVGVVSNEVFPDAANPIVPQIYTPQAQHPAHGAALLVETLGDPLAAAVPIRRLVLALDPEQPIADVRTQSRIFADELATMDTIAGMFVGFAFFALVMAGAGIYGVLSFLVTQRTHEIGIRMALGARRGEVRGLVMRSSGRLVLLGVVVGSAGAFGLASIMASGIPGITAADPLVFASVAAVLLAVAAGAAWIPALRATRVEPVVALRAE